MKRFRDDIETTSTEGYVSCCAAMVNEDLRESLGSLRCPLLAIAGASDQEEPFNAALSDFWSGHPG